MWFRWFVFGLALCVLGIHATPLAAQQAYPPEVKEEEKVAEAAGNEPAAASPSPARFQMDEVVVTATREEDVVRRIPRNVSVITSEDIAQAPSNRVTDLLSRQSGLNLQSNFGHDKGAVIDMRGMGATATSNVIVMVDGFRLNTPDLAGADYATIPIDQIERVEVVRGAGSVLYGDGATGGVINIITKRGGPERQTRVYGTYGSYESSDVRSSTSGQLGFMGYRTNASYYTTSGYRDNNDYWRRNLEAVLDFNLSDMVTASLGYNYHEDEVGFPGPLPRELNNTSRRNTTRYPEDESETTEHRYRGGVALDFANGGLLDLQVAFRDRDNDYVLGYTKQLSKSEQTDEITEDTLQTNVVYSNTFNAFERRQTVRCGLDYFYTDYRRHELESSRKNRDVYKTEGFAHAELELPGNLLLSGGFRKSFYEGDFRDDSYEDFFTTPPPPPPIIPPEYLGSDWVKGRDETERWENEAWDVGLTWLAGEHTSLFASVAQSYRIPNVDELTLAADDLEPQEGFHVDLGLRTQVPGLMELALAFFYIRIEDEIYYGEDPGPPIQQLNRNYDEDTLRRGVEVDLRIYPLESLFLQGTFAYVNAEFDETNTNIPLVPDYKGSVGLEWQILEPLTLSLVGTFVSSSYDGNDQSNDLYAKLGSYDTYDAKMTYQYRGLKLFCGLNNIFDEKYVTVGYSESIYPMPERNAFGGMEWVF